MCLEYIGRVKPALEGIGYKVFVTGNAEGVYHPEYRKEHNIYYEEGRWYRASGLVVATNIKMTRYNAGFHIFRDYETAREWIAHGDYTIKKVKYRGAHTQGAHSMHGRCALIKNHANNDLGFEFRQVEAMGMCIIADKMMIVEDDD